MLTTFIASGGQVPQGMPEAGPTTPTPLRWTTRVASSERNPATSPRTNTPIITGHQSHWMGFQWKDDKGQKTVDNKCNIKNNNDNKKKL